MWPQGLTSYHSILLRHQIHADFEEDYNNDKIPRVDLNQNICRTQLLLLDYKQFKAARLIQRHFRGWSVRHMMHKQRRAAIIIQRKWRIYLIKKNILINYQNKTQSNILMTFNSNSIKIQALFRGWWSRKYVNNMIYLKSIQVKAVEDILHCISYELHTMKRNNQLPGYLSLRQGDCLRKVEDLISTLTYRLYNRYVGMKWLDTRAYMNKQRSDFANSIFYTSVPYYGNDPINVCAPPPPPKSIKIYDRREYDVTQALMAGKKIKPEHKGKHPKYRKRQIKDQGISCKLFCKDLVYSMKRWNIGDQHKLIIPDDILDGNLQEFIMDLKGYLEKNNYVENCDCVRDKPNPAT
ncbi:uncharacterized protein LOC117780750 [Drosophila innubila]|uniref:uncharacterized protein LOC117780750 n=1 Tax=Drosophila innubila TaxID=198719 RepID=UPI00148BA56E|nr:uncharacterized protein LOC117780750 [Drosophila innubila]